MNGFTLSSVTVGPWRIMALMPWINVLWAAAMLLVKSREPWFLPKIQRKKQALHGLIIDHIRKIARWHFYLDVSIDVSHMGTTGLQYL